MKIRTRPGLRGLGQGDFVGPPIPGTEPSPVSGSSFDWGALIKGVSSVGTSYLQSRTALETAKLQAQQRAAYPYQYPLTSRTGTYSGAPLPGGGFSDFPMAAPDNTLLYLGIGAAFVVGAFILSR